ncbi:MAG: GntR family transcriptional regulator [Dongiaceae bacterium]
MPQDTARPVRRADPETIYAEIRDRICLLVYPPGTRLREGALAAEFGVSRTPIRETLQRLAFLGLVEVRNGVGTIVTELDRSEIVDLYRMRLKVAELIGEMSPRPVTADQIRDVGALLVRARALEGRFDAREYWQINHRMHFIIGAIIGNAGLRRMWDQFYFQIARVWYGVIRELGPETARMLVEEIGDVLRAMRENDAAAIGFIQRNYIAYGLKRVLAEYGDASASGPDIGAGPLR